MFLGSSQKGSLDLTGALVEIGKLNQLKLEWMIKIQTSNACTPFVVGSVSREQAIEWKKLIDETALNASARVITILFRLTIFVLVFPFYFVFIYLFLSRKRKTKKWNVS